MNKTNKQIKYQYTVKNKQLQMLPALIIKANKPLSIKYQIQGQTYKIYFIYNNDNNNERHEFPRE